jgi:hypothetical protein
MALSGSPVSPPSPLRPVVCARGPHHDVEQAQHVTDAHALLALPPRQAHRNQDPHEQHAPEQPEGEHCVRHARGEVVGHHGSALPLALRRRPSRDADVRGDEADHGREHGNRPRRQRHDRMGDLTKSRAGLSSLAGVVAAHDAILAPSAPLAPGLEPGTESRQDVT